MRRIIDGKLYDTETATEIYCWDNGYHSGDFKWYQESLYQKKTGEFFIYGKGGPLSKYGEECGNGYRYGDGFLLIDEAEAKDWLETYADADTYIRIFGDVEE